MRKTILAVAIATIPAVASAQSAVDALQISQPDFKGTARFMSMGGAFTALGGDLSAVTQNPASIGVYRSSELGVTLDIDFQSTKTSPAFPAFSSSNSQTKAYCNNFGYVGTVNLDGALKTFNFGVSYNRAASFDRVYSGYVASTQTSLSNYIASITNGVNWETTDTYGGFTAADDYDPYLDSDHFWLSVLGFNSYMINPTSANTYQGLYGNGSSGDALYSVREKGRIDQYDFTFGGNVENIVNWGISFGVTDLDYTRYTSYSESLDNSPLADGGVGASEFYLDNSKNISGTGWNMKFGVIIKPINELRFGLAVHTPTWYKLDQKYFADVYYKYTNPDLPESDTNPYTNMNPGDKPEGTPEAFFNWRLNSPWRLMAGVAGVIGSQAIISLDYEYDGYNSMSMKTPVYDNYGYVLDFQSDEFGNEDIKNYYKGASTIRLGLEYRITPQLSARAGYNYTSSFTKSDAADGRIGVSTSGTDPSYSFDKSIQHITLGLGYKYKMWYIDAAYVYKHRESTYHAYTNFDQFQAPTSKLTDNNSSIVISTGFKF